MVGHTHEDVDQLFGVITALLVRKVHYETPSELLQYLRTSLDALFRAKGERLHVQHLTTIRQFGQWLQPIGRVLYNAFMTRNDIEAPHSFGFKQRRDISVQELGADVRMAAESEEHRAPDDVMCCVKTYMQIATCSNLQFVLCQLAVHLQWQPRAQLGFEMSHHYPQHK